MNLNLNSACSIFPFHDKWVPMTRPQVANEKASIWRVAANILNKQSRTADKGFLQRGCRARF